MRVAGESGAMACKWLKTELPHLLDQIRMLVATWSLQGVRETQTPQAVHVTSDLVPLPTDNCSSPQGESSSTEDSGNQVEPTKTEGAVQLSRAEAKQAWLTAGGDTERAARQALRDRVTKVTNCFHDCSESLVRCLNFAGSVLR